VSTVLAASIAGALAAFSVEWLFKPRLEIRADTLRARRDVMLVLRYYLQLAPALTDREVWERAPAEIERRGSLILDDARKLETLLPRTVRKGWVHWRWPEVAGAVAKLSGYVQGRLLVSTDSPLDLPAAIEAVADPLVERDGTSRLFWRRRRALLDKATTAATALGTG
jgi:hypothetical protein